MKNPPQSLNLQRTLLIPYPSQAYFIHTFLKQKWNPMIMFGAGNIYSVFLMFPHKGTTLPITPFLPPHRGVRARTAG